MDPSDKVTLTVVSGAVAIFTLVAKEIATRFKTTFDRKAAEAALSNTRAETDVKKVDALASAMEAITASLRDIQDLRGRLGQVEQDLIAARAECRRLADDNETLKAQSIADRASLDMALQTQQATQARLDQARGDIRQLRQVITSIDKSKMPKLADDENAA